MTRQPPPAINFVTSWRSRAARYEIDDPPFRYTLDAQIGGALRVTICPLSGLSQQHPPRIGRRLRDLDAEPVT